MNRSDLVNVIANSAECSKTTANQVLTDLFGAMEKGLSKGDTIAITGFGTFKVAKRAARLGKNPRTGEALKIAASKVVRFSVGTKLKASVNKK